MSAPGFVSILSDADFATTVARLDKAFAARGVAPLARIDHAAAGVAAGMPLAPTLLLIFGNPRIGTPLMQQARSWAIDLPLKLLAWEDAGEVWLGYTDPAWLAARHGAGLAASVESMRRLLADLASDAAGSQSA